MKIDFEFSDGRTSLGDGNTGWRERGELGCCAAPSSRSSALNIPPDANAGYICHKALPSRVTETMSRVSELSSRRSAFGAASVAPDSGRNRPSFDLLAVGRLPSLTALHSYVLSCQNRSRKTHLERAPKPAFLQADAVHFSSEFVVCSFFAHKTQRVQQRRPAAISLQRLVTKLQYSFIFILTFVVFLSNSFRFIDFALS